MKQVLWISRHRMTVEQTADLERILGGAFKLVQFSNTVCDITALQPQFAQADVVAAVLPLELLAELLQCCFDKPVLIAVSERVPTGRLLALADGRTEQEFQFVHRCWKKLIRVEVETRTL